jgi:hypothetical protein
MADVQEHVAVYYNSQLLISTLGYTTPMNYEKWNAPRMVDTAKPQNEAVS